MVHGPPTLKCSLDFTVGIPDSWAELIRADLVWVRVFAAGGPNVDPSDLEGFQQWAMFAKTQYQSPTSPLGRE